MAKKLSSLAPSYDINIPVKFFNEAYLPYLEKTWEWEIFFGSAGSGKSHFIAHKDIMFLSQTCNAGENMLCLRLHANDCRDSVYPEIYNAIKDFGLMDVWNIVEHPMVRLSNIANGNEIVFGGLDDVENIKSIKFKNGNLTRIWIEEATEIEEMRDIRQLRARLRDRFHRSCIQMSFNPVLASHPLKKFIEEELVPLGDNKCIYVKTTYKDNRFLNDDYIQYLESARFTDPYWYMVYALGEWGTTGQSVFDANKIYARLKIIGETRDANPVLVGNFAWSRDEKTGFIDKESFTFYSAPGGETTIYKPPIKGHPYVVAFDPSGEGDDFSAAQVCDNTTGEQVAVFHSNQNPDICVYQVYGLCRHYNNALFAPEVNFGAYELEKFKEFKYNKIYQRGTPVDAYSDGYEQKLGFRTTSGNRMKMLAACVEWVNANTSLINDERTLNEMLVFTRQSKKMKGIWWGAEQGSHDDLVMSFAIMLQAREQQLCEPENSITEITGTWLDAELNDALKQGRVTLSQVRDYKKKHSGMFGRKTFTSTSKRKGSVYDR